MDATEAREMFDEIIQGTDEPDRIARLELAREYFCNPKFRAALQDYMFALTTNDENYAPPPALSKQLGLL